MSADQFTDSGASGRSASRLDTECSIDPSFDLLMSVLHSIVLLLHSIRFKGGRHVFNVVKVHWQCNLNFKKFHAFFCFSLRNNSSPHIGTY